MFPQNVNSKVQLSKLFLVAQQSFFLEKNHKDLSTYPIRRTYSHTCIIIQVYILHKAQNYFLILKSLFRQAFDKLEIYWRFFIILDPPEHPFQFFYFIFSHLAKFISLGISINICEHDFHLNSIYC